MSSEPDDVARSEASVARLFDRHARAVFGLAFALLRDADEAQDVVQDVFVVAWRKRRSITLVDGSALPWLLTTTRLTALAARRRSARRRTDTVPDDDLHAIPAAAEPAEVEAVRAAVAGLADDDRRIVTLVLVDGLSYAEAADRLGVTVSAAGKRLQRAKARLRADLAHPAEGTAS